MSAFLLLDLLAALGIGAFVFLGLLIPLTALWSEFLPSIGGFFNPEVLAAAKITALQAGASAAIATVLGVAIAWVLPRDSRRVRALLGIPFGIPAVAASAAWIVLLPKSLSFSLDAVIIAHVFFNTPWVALWVLRALDEVSVAEKEAAATLGASPARVFRFVTFPAISPAIASVFAQVFSFCAMSFILVMILGGGPPVETLETTLFSKIRAGGLDLSGASVCAIWQIVITLTPWVLFRRLRKAEISLGNVSRQRSGSRPSPAFGFALASVFLWPYLSLFSGLHLSVLWKDPATHAEIVAAAGTSFSLAGVTAILSVGVALLGVWAEHRSRLFAQLGSLLLVIPSGISIMVLGLGFFIAFEKYLDPFSPSLWPIAFLQAILFVPIAFRVFQAIGQRRDLAAWDASLTLGASPLRSFFWIEWPRWREPIAAVLTLIAGAALGEVAAVSLFFNERRIPLSLLISRWMGQYRFEEAQALSLLLMLASAGLIAAGFWRSTAHSDTIGLSPEVAHE